MRFCYRTIEFGDVDIHLRTLRDANEFPDDGADADDAEALGISPARWPLFGVVWGSSYVLAAMMVHADIAGLRILEVGCGIGLASMVLNQRGADITATDRHPNAQQFLDHNTELNGEPEIAFQLSDWGNTDDTLGQFDLIIASDLLYDRDQAAPLSRFIVNHSLPHNQVVLVDPGRGQAGHFGRLMTGLGFSHDQRHAKEDESLRFGRDVGARLQIHSFNRS